MSKVAVLLMEGFEEGETFTIVDVMRRLDIPCDTFYFDGPWVKGIADDLYRALAKDVDVYELCEINAGSDFYNTIFAEGVQIA